MTQAPLIVSYELSIEFKDMGCSTQIDPLRLEDEIARLEADPDVKSFVIEEHTTRLFYKFERKAK